jgi:VanZ family protein
VSQPRLASSGLWRWGPLILWMAVISLFSTDAFAASETSRYIGPILRWLFPTASSATMDAVHNAIRKGMHVGEFAILAFLWYRSLNWGQQARKPKAALAAFALTVAFAGLDEAHQAFVTTRTASLMDVGWDGLGALCGVVGSGVLLGGGGASSVKNADATKEDPPGRLTVPFDD